MYYTREQIRSFIRCPQLGSEDYGEWGALRLEQRLAINSMLDQLDSADAYIRQLEKENESKEKAYTDCYCDFKHYKQFESIPKSVIREKIEELESYIQEMSDEQGYWGSKNPDEIYNKIDVLEELLGEKDENRNKI